MTFQARYGLGECLMNLGRDRGTQEMFFKIIEAQAQRSSLLFPAE